MLDVIGIVAAGCLTLFGAWVVGMRRKLRRGKRVLPRMRFRSYFSIRSPESTPPDELEPVDTVEIIQPRPRPLPPLPPELDDDFDTRDTPDPRPPRRRRR